jgi:nucleoside-diphosphate-sugar epimerase
LATEVIRLTASESAIIYKTLPTDDPRKRQPDIERARTVLGWTPRIGLAEGLVRTISYFRQLLGD